MEFHVHCFAPIASSSLLWHLWDSYDSIFNPSHWTFMHLPPTKLLFGLFSAVPLLCWWHFSRPCPRNSISWVGAPRTKSQSSRWGFTSAEQKGHHLPQPLTMFFLVQVIYFLPLSWTIPISSHINTKCLNVKIREKTQTTKINNNKKNQALKST